MCSRLLRLAVHCILYLTVTITQCSSDITSVEVYYILRKNKSNGDTKIMISR